MEEWGFHQTVVGADPQAGHLAPKALDRVCQARMSSAAGTCSLEARVPQADFPAPGYFGHRVLGE
ncbi:hypothetical protein C6A85_74120 [Mycobacterium sp. ITM-2017-0098]|nr:hypothetical protein C6A85_74120 [Mycobacterium sp. ITM-2017-0098]